MWCKNCNLETNETHCPVCNTPTSEEIPIEIFFCDECKIPILNLTNAIDKGICPVCGNQTRYLSSDLRPVFPEERLLLASLLNKNPTDLMQQSIWSVNNRYFIDGKPIAFPNKTFTETDTKNISEKISKYSDLIDYTYFTKNITDFIKANQSRFSYLKEEASNFIRETANNFEEENIVISFSGGKDSTVTTDLVTKALSNPSLVHIFGNTTLEFPTTLDYSKRFRNDHPLAIFQIAKNEDQDFFDVCKDIGPPARMMRWCCSMFKTGPISRIINSLYRNQQILTFYGIRKSESVSRSKYNRIEENTESVKIQQQTVASPIFFWKDLDVWLYILTEKLDFNFAYRLGYDRVGCWCCPNNNQHSQFLSQIYLPEESKKWRSFLIDFAREIGKPDPETYIDEGKWKARQGGNGLASAKDVKIRFTNCTTEENAKIYQLLKPYSDDLINMFVPFGKIAPELGQKIIQETIILDRSTNVPILSIQPFDQSDFDYAVKIKAMNIINHEDLQRMVAYQIKKYNACRKCLKCESICRQGAISIVGDSYYIDPEKCIGCKKCMNAKFLRGGCMMDKYLRTK